MNIISTAYAQGLGGVLATAPAAQLAAYIAAASRRIERYCDRWFYARRFQNDFYDGVPDNFLALRHAPLAQLNQVTLFPDGPNPQVFAATAFDVRYGPARISFVPGQNGTFFSMFAGAGRWERMRNIILVDSFCGYGWVTTLTAAVAAGANVALPLAAAGGYLPDQGAWSVAAGFAVVLDSGQPTEETVQITVSGGTVTASNVAFAHAAGSFVSGSRDLGDVQLACALLVTNLINAGDLTKQAETLARMAYGSTTRTGDAIFTPEIKSLLTPYKEICV